MNFRVLPLHLQMEFTTQALYSKRQKGYSEFYIFFLLQNMYMEYTIVLNSIAQIREQFKIQTERNTL